MVSTISGGIVVPEKVADPQTFIWAKMSALIAASLWLYLATWFGAPVSTTHAIVGGVMGGGYRGSGFRSRGLGQVWPDRRKLVRRGHVLSIGAARVVTVPLTAVLSALLFVLLRKLV